MVFLNVCIFFFVEQLVWFSTQVGMIQLGDMWFLIMFGELVIELGVGVVFLVKDVMGVTIVYFLGYVQDYIGYSLIEEDWYWGGYEVAGSIWGLK